jgi:alpha-L-fucosidase
LKNVIPVKDSKIYLLGYETPLDWATNVTNETVIKLPDVLKDPSRLPCKYAWTLKIQLVPTPEKD